MDQDENDRKDAEYAAAEKRFAEAIRRYLWDVVRITGDPEWEEGLDFALLAINRVLLKDVWKMQKMEQMEETDVLLSDLTDDMAEELGEPPTYPDRPIRY